MKKFLIKIVCLSAIVGTIAVVLNFCIEKYIRKMDSKWEKIFDSKVDANVLILGSSRALNHIVPEVLDSILKVNSYNLGEGGYPFSIEYAQFKIYEKYGNPKPELIIQSADLFTLVKKEDAYNTELTMPYLYEPILKNELEKIYNFSSADFFLPAFKYRSKLVQINRNKKMMELIAGNPLNKKGFIAQDDKWRGFELAVQLAGDSIDGKMDSDMVNLFDEYLNHCKQSGIKVVMVFTPEYYKATEYTSNREKIKNIYRSFSKKYDFPFLDYSTDPLCYDTIYFYNAMHLNGAGAKIFSKELAHDIDSLGILK